MRSVALGLCLCVLLAGCTLSEVNQVAIIKYHRQDHEGMMALKTLGNVVAWPVVAGGYAGFYAFLFWLEAGAPQFWR